MTSDLTHRCPWVEHDEATERCEAPQETRERGPLPDGVDAITDGGHEDYVELSFAQDLTGDASLAELRVPGPRSS